jgi:lipopolysaccharide export system permease protein
MIQHRTLVQYLTKQFIKQFLLSSAVVVFILCITNAFDVLKIFKDVDLTIGDFWKLIIFRIPYFFGEVITLICFISTFLFVRNISRYHELVVVLGSGVPIWRVFAGPVFSVLLIGILALLVINPIGTYGLRNYSSLESKLRNDSHLNFIISRAGIFFFEKFVDNNRVIQAKSIDADTKLLSDVTVLMVDEHNNFIKRVDAQRAILDQGQFILEKPVVTFRDTHENLEEMALPTKLSVNNLMQRFSPPEMIFIWNLSHDMKNFMRSGLIVTKYQIHYYKQLFKPFAMVAMALIGCWFVSLNMRDNSGARAAIYGLVVGVCSYFFLEISVRMLVYSGLTPLLATLLPILFIILISNFVILHFQEA